MTLSRPFGRSTLPMLPEHRVQQQWDWPNLASGSPTVFCADADGAIWAGCVNTGEFVRVQGGEITRSIQFEGAAVSSAIGSETGTRLFMTVYRGSVKGVAMHRRKAAVYVVDLKESR